MALQAYQQVLLQAMAGKKDAQFLQVGEAAQVVDLAGLHRAAQAVNVEAHQLAETGEMDQVISPHHRRTVADI